MDPEIRDAIAAHGSIAEPPALAGTGVFSEVWRLVLDGQPVVAKVPVLGPAGDAGRASGAYDRERLAYEALLPHLDVGSPQFVVTVPTARGPVLVMEDLADSRFCDQQSGLDLPDVVALAGSLGRLHRSAAAIDLPPGVRGPAPAAHDRQGLERGLARIAQEWSAMISSGAAGAFARLGRDLDGEIEQFAAVDGVLNHGDPRAGNVAFRPNGKMCWFDWQMIAVQAPAGDLAWLLATSVQPEFRAEVVGPALDAAGLSFEDYRMGLTHPATAVLLLAARPPANQQVAELVVSSLDRIGDALAAADR